MKQFPNRNFKRIYLKLRIRENDKSVSRISYYSRNGHSSRRNVILQLSEQSDGLQLHSVTKLYSLACLSPYEKNIRI